MMLIKKKRINNVHNLYEYLISLEGKPLPDSKTVEMLEEKLHSFVKTEEMDGELRYCRFMFGLIRNDVALLCSQPEK